MLAEQCRKSKEFSCPYIARNVILTEADNIQKLYDSGKVDAVKLSETIHMLEEVMDNAEEVVCMSVNQSDVCPVDTNMEEATRLFTAYDCDRSEKCICPHLRVDVATEQEGA